MVSKFRDWWQKGLWWKGNIFHHKSMEPLLRFHDISWLQVQSVVGGYDVQQRREEHRWVFSRAWHFSWGCWYQKIPCALDSKNGEFATFFRDTGMDSTTEEVCDLYCIFIFTDAYDVDTSCPHAYIIFLYMCTFSLIALFMYIIHKYVYFYIIYIYISISIKTSVFHRLMIFFYPPELMEVGKTQAQRKKKAGPPTWELAKSKRAGKVMKQTKAGSKSKWWICCFFWSVTFWTLEWKVLETILESLLVRGLVPWMISWHQASEWHGNQTSEAVLLPSL